MNQTKPAQQHPKIKSFFFMGSPNISWLLLTVILFNFLGANESTERWYESVIQWPDSIKVKLNRPVTIAIVDDGISNSHEWVKDMIWQNPNETPANGIDDDGNGYIDDVWGWDVADGNNNPSIPPSRKSEFYHGTHNAGIIADLIKKVNLEKYVKIISVKSLPDQAKDTYLKDGYRGIEYSVNIKADIINCSWGGGMEFSDYHEKILKSAEDNKLIVVGSAGNFNTYQPQYPAAYPSILAVASLGKDLKKSEKSNFGSYIDLAIPGEKIMGADVKSDTSFKEGEGTSASVSIVSAALAVMMLTQENPDVDKIKRCIKNTTKLIDNLNLRYSGKLGAGVINVKAALQCLETNKTTAMNISIHRPKGFVEVHQKGAGFFKHFFGSASANEYSWIIKPFGKNAGIRFLKTNQKQKPSEGNFQLLKWVGNHWEPSGKYNLQNYPDSLYIAGDSAKLSIKIAAKEDLNWLIGYEVATIDSSKMFCKETKRLELMQGTFTDGSGKNNYAWNSDCKWLITVPKGHYIELGFTDFDTQEKTDWLYAFDGNGTHSKITGILSGPNLPPMVRSSGNQMLVWFVTDGEIQKGGWTAHYIAKPYPKK